MVLLDTCAWLWYVNGDAEQLSKPAGAAIERAGRLLVSVISVWEVSNLVALRRIGLSLDLDTWIERALSADRIELAPLSVKVATESTRLPGEVHRDPADRMLIATSRACGAPVVTPDDKIRSYPHVQSVW